MSISLQCNLGCYKVSRIPFPSPKTWTIISNLWNFFLFFKNLDYHMQFQKFLSFLQKTWTIICNLWNFFLFSKNLDYHMQVSRIPFPSPKTWTIISNLWNFFLFFKKVDYHMQFSEFLSRLQKHGLSYAILGILSLQQKCEQSYEIYGISFPSPKT